MKLLRTLICVSITIFVYQLIDRLFPFVVVGLLCWLIYELYRQNQKPPRC